MAADKSARSTDSCLQSTSADSVEPAAVVNAVEPACQVLLSADTQYRQLDSHSPLDGSIDTVYSLRALAGGRQSVEYRQNLLSLIATQRGYAAERICAANSCCCISNRQ
jgi:hypothetical protein